VIYMKEGKNGKGTEQQNTENAKDFGEIPGSVFSKKMPQPESVIKETTLNNPKRKEWAESINI